MSKHFQEVAKKFSGDTELASKYMGVARQLLGGLKEISGGLFQNSRRVLLPDGTRITVGFAGSVARVEIDARSVSSSPDDGACKMIHGLSVGNLVMREDWEPATYSVGDIRQPDDEDAMFYWFHPGGATNTPVANREWMGTDVLLAQMSRIPRTSPAMYSGRMRAAVQLLFGAGIPVTYDWSWDSTHGIAINNKKAPWLIWISSQYGVLAIPMPRMPCVVKIKDSVTRAAYMEQLNGIMPSGGSFPSDVGILNPGGGLNLPSELDNAIASGEVIRLMPAANLSDFYDGKIPLFNDSGWAFSNGAVASNTCYNWGHDGYIRSYLYDITILFDSDGVPYHATLNLSESGVIVGNGTKACLLKYPSNLGMWLDTFDARPIGDPPPTVLAHYGEVAPLYVFYDGSAKIVVKNRNAAQALAPYIVTNEDQYIYYWPRFIAGFGEDYFRKQYYSGAMPGYGVFVENILPFKNSTGEYSELRVSYAGDPTFSETQVISSDGLTFSAKWVSSNGMSLSSYAAHNVTESTINAVAIPLYDREAIYTFTQTTENHVASTVTHGTGYRATSCGAFYGNTGYLGHPVDDTYMSVLSGSAVCDNGDEISSSYSTAGVSIVSGTRGVGDVWYGAEMYHQGPNPVIVSESTPARTVREATLKYVASGNHRVQLPAQLNIANSPWFDVSSIDNKQLITSTHSAFNPHAYVASEDLGAVSGEGSVVYDNLYPVDDPRLGINGSVARAFVGVS